MTLRPKPPSSSWSMNLDSTEWMQVPWMSPGANSPLRRFTAKTSTQKECHVRSPRQVKNENQSGAQRPTVRELLRILPEAIGPKFSVLRKRLLAGPLGRETPIFARGQSTSFNPDGSDRVVEERIARRP